jgi:hypothetical protein
MVIGPLPAANRWSWPGSVWRPPQPLVHLRKAVSQWLRLRNPWSSPSTIR